MRGGAGAVGPLVETKRMGDANKEGSTVKKSALRIAVLPFWPGKA